MIKNRFNTILKRTYVKGEFILGRDDKKGSSHNKDTLPQTPKNEKISPNKIREEFSRELAEIERAAKRLNRKK